MMKHILVFILFLTLAQSCGDDSKDNNNSGGGGGASSSSTANGIEVELTSSDLSAKAQTSSKRSIKTNCNLSTGSTNHSGSCITPLNMVAKVRQINLGNSYGSQPARIIDFSAAPENEPENAPNGVLGLSDYNFANAATNTNAYSDDNIQDNSATYFNTANLELGSLDIQIEIPSSNINVTNRFWTIRYMFFPQNPLDKSEIDSCATDSAIRSRIESGGDLYSSPENFQHGDILICQKSLEATECSDSDFQWINSTNGALASTRPSSPVALGGDYVLQDDSCEQNGGNLVLGGSNMQVNLSNGVNLTKTRDAEDCLYQYNFQTSCTVTGSESGSCSDSAQSGFGITISLDFDITESVFVKNTIDLENNTEADILQNLEDLLPKPLFIENNKTAIGTGNDTDMEATLTITVNNDAADNALEERGEDPNDYDDDYCFIEE